MRWVAVSVWVMWLLGCDPSVFDDIKKSTPVIDIKRPGSMQFESFGSTVLGYVTESDGVLHSRLATSSGPATPIRVNRGWNGEGLDVEKKALELCVDPAACDAAQILSMLPLRRWGDQTMCIASAGPESATRANAALNIVCESDPTQTIVQEAPPGINFGASAAQLPQSIEPLGLAIVGAPFENATDGRLYLIADNQAPVPVALSDSTAVDGLQGRLGSSLAAGAWESGQAVVATTSPGTQTVVVGLLNNTDATLAIHACIQGDSNWAPVSLTIGNLNGESGSGSVLAPELAIGVDTTSDGVVDHLEIFDGQYLPDAGCGPWGHEPLVINCPDDVAEEFSCTEALFAASIAIGDLNGDGIGDLMIGAPGATARGKLQAGSVVVYVGTLRNDTGELQFEPPIVVHHPHPSTGARLGSSVAALSTGQAAYRRDELIAGAPGQDDDSGMVTAFLCTPVAADTSSSSGLDARCLPSSD